MNTEMKKNDKTDYKSFFPFNFSIMLFTLFYNR